MPARLLFFCLIPSLVLVSACAEPIEPIETYNIPKEDTVFDANHTKTAAAQRRRFKKLMQPRVPKKARMLGLIVIDEANENGWFFKLLGPIDEVRATTVANGKAPFFQLIDSIKFVDGKPTWKVPAGWKQLPDDDPRNTTPRFPRFATILTGADDDAAEFTVSKLGFKDFQVDDYVLFNVNRWRGQVGLADTTKAELYRKATNEEKQKKMFSQVDKRTVDGKPAFVTHMEGVTGGAPRRRRGPFMR